MTCGVGEVRGHLQLAVSGLRYRSVEPAHYSHVFENQPSAAKRVDVTRSFLHIRAQSGAALQR